MAKKGQTVQLQAEVNTDEEFEKLLQKDGLIVIDIYSEWCGPCSGMSATLKKLKLEIGGDLLHLAMAKSDSITALARFRNKSEPTWMLVANGKMVNFMFGANAPKLTQIIIDELKKEKEAREGMRERVQMEIDELAAEEQERLDQEERRNRAGVEKEKREQLKKLRDRLTAEANNILENLAHLGVVLVFPHAKAHYTSVFNEFLGEAGLTVLSTEKTVLTERILQDLFYFEEDGCPFSEETIEDIVDKESLAILMRPTSTRELKEPVEDTICRMIYGESMAPPGDPNSPADRLAEVAVEEPPEDEDAKSEDLLLQSQKHPTSQTTSPKTRKVSVWTTHFDMVKATCLKIFFIKQTEKFLIPEPEEVPLCAVVFDAYRAKEIAKMMEKYRSGVLRYGFFTSEVPKKAELIARNMDEFRTKRQPNAKLVIELSKKKSEAVFAFAQQSPLYMSANNKVGKIDCKTFFPTEYDPIDEDDTFGLEEEKETVVVEAKAAAVAAAAEVKSVAGSEAAAEDATGDEAETAAGEAVGESGETTQEDGGGAAAENAEAASGVLEDGSPVQVKSGAELAISAGAPSGTALGGTTAAEGGEVTAEENAPQVAPPPEEALAAGTDGGPQEG